MARKTSTQTQTTSTKPSQFPAATKPLDDLRFSWWLECRRAAKNLADFQQRLGTEWDALRAFEWADDALLGAAKMRVFNRLEAQVLVSLRDGKTDQGVLNDLLLLAVRESALQAGNGRSGHLDRAAQSAEMGVWASVARDLLSASTGGSRW